MKTKRISDAREAALNKQMTREALQAQVYLSYASWAELNSFSGIANFLYKHMHEEREHMFKILKFINDRGGEIRIEAIGTPPENPENIEDCLKRVLQHEIDNSKQIDNLVDQGFEEKDWATFSFTQWFVKEQIEEEALINRLLDKYALASEQKEGNADFYELDKDLNKAPQSAKIPREEEF